ncbi:MAG: hypothetical protein EOO38_10195, partial [Cytophagaceae bacterium]
MLLSPSYLYISIFALAFASCKKDWLDVNTNPNQLLTSTPDFVFPSTACLVQAQIGAKGAAAFDVQ